jgi:hypothetical protein
MKFAAGTMKIAAREFRRPRLQATGPAGSHCDPLPGEEKQIGKIE